MGGRITPSEREIRRYANRKLYEPRGRRYVTLADIERLIAAGETVRVVDQKSGDDLTTSILAQVLVDTLKRRTTDLPGHFLAQVIRAATTDASARSQAPSASAPSPAHVAEEIVTRLVSRGRVGLDEAVALRKEIAGTIQHAWNDAQVGVEKRIAQIVTSARRAAPPALAGIRDRFGHVGDYFAGTKSEPVAVKEKEKSSWPRRRAVPKARKKRPAGRRRAPRA